MFAFVYSNCNSLTQLPLQLSETKIFTASSVASMPLPQENVTITKGQRSLVHYITNLNNAFKQTAFSLNWLREKSDQFTFSGGVVTLPVQSHVINLTC